MKERYVRVRRQRTVTRQADVFVDEWVCDRMMELGLNVGYVAGDKLYPWAVTDDAHRRPVAPLHRFVLRLAVEAGQREQLGAGDVIHHRNTQKGDARLSNLEVLPAGDHARHHAQERRERTRRKVQDQRLKGTGLGWWRPQAPG